MSETFQLFEHEIRRVLWTISARHSCHCPVNTPAHQLYHHALRNSVRQAANCAPWDNLPPPSRLAEYTTYFCPHAVIFQEYILHSLCYNLSAIFRSQVRATDTFKYMWSSCNCSYRSSNAFRIWTLWNTVPFVSYFPRFPTKQTFALQHKHSKLLETLT